MITGMVFSGTSVLMEQLRIPAPPEGIADGLEWRGYGLMIPEEFASVVWVFWLAGLVVGLLGFLLFESWSRLLLLGVMIGAVLLSPFSGLNVSWGVYNAPGYIGSLFIFLPLVLPFFPPCSDYFARSDPVESGSASRVQP